MSKAVVEVCLCVLVSLRAWLSFVSDEFYSYMLEVGMGDADMETTLWHLIELITFLHLYQLPWQRITLLDT